MKKEAFYTAENIDSKSSSFLDELKSKHLYKHVDFQIKNSALLVLDMQDFFLNTDSHAYIPSASAIIPNIKQLISFYKKNNRPVIFTKHTNDKQNASKMGTWWKDLILTNSKQSEIIDDFDLTDAILVEKHQYDAFFNTKLETILKEKETKQVVITGVMTHLCCETTARSAFIKGYDVFFGVDTTATYSEEFHQASILNLSHGFATPVIAKNLVEGNYA